MKALLDTHTFLWAITDQEELSPRAQQIYTGPNDRWLSVASVWEILIKVFEEGWPIVSADPLFARYPVDVIW